MDADDHTLIDIFTRTDKQTPAFLQIKECVSQALAGPGSDQDPVTAVPDLAGLQGAIAIEGMIHKPGARSEGKKFCAKTDQSAGRDPIIEAHPSLAVRLHSSEIPLALAQPLHHRALGLDGYIDRQLFIGLTHLPV